MGRVQLHIAAIDDVPPGWECALPRIAGRYRALALEAGPEEERRAELCAGLLLAHALGVADDGQLTSGDAGKPALAAGTPAFNLSHGGGLVALAVADDEVGVDVERIPAAYGPAQQAAARRVLPDEALAQLADATAVEAPRAFARAWTRLEAVLKARGSGFRDDPRAHPEVLAGWTVESVEHRGHVLSVAQRGPVAVDVTPVDIARLVREAACAPGDGDAGVSGGNREEGGRA